jgi:1-aminocyclopropane-1-carboxylate deaminase/D-cysteine desulfhydrase-like pyridoxal-dependent ACC family enzyme
MLLLTSVVAGFRSGHVRLMRLKPQRVAFDSTSSGSGSSGVRGSGASPVQSIEVRGRRVLVKRDDLFRDAASIGIAGNKARKLWSLSQVPAERFPPCIVSHGGPQSNSMLSLAAVVHAKRQQQQEQQQQQQQTRELDEEESNNGNGNNKNHNNNSSVFVYYTKMVPRWLRSNPSGNYARALALGMEVRQLPHATYDRIFASCEGVGDRPAELYESDSGNGDNRECASSSSSSSRSSRSSSSSSRNDDTTASQLLRLPRGSLWVPQGGACADAEEGLALLAGEIADAWYARAPAMGAAAAAAEDGGGGSGGGGTAAAAAGGHSATTAATIHRLTLLQEEDEGKDSGSEGDNGSSHYLRQSGPGRRGRQRRRAGAGGPPGQPQPPRLVVVVPAGTGTTALFLGRHLRERGVAVVAVPCVGDPKGRYLKRQMARLDRETGGTGDVRDLPLVLEPKAPVPSTAASLSSSFSLPSSSTSLSSESYSAPFGKPREGLLRVWRQLNGESGLYLDLLYGARAWEVLLSRWDSLPRVMDPEMNGAQLMYLHCGGLEGISSQLNRYRHAGLIDAKEAMS